MPGAHFKQVAKDARAACKQFLDEPFAEVENRVVNLRLQLCVDVLNYVGSRDRS